MPPCSECQNILPPGFGSQTNISYATCISIALRQPPLQPPKTFRIALHKSAISINQKPVVRVNYRTQNWLILIGWFACRTIPANANDEVQSTPSTFRDLCTAWHAVFMFTIHKLPKSEYVAPIVSMRKWKCVQLKHKGWKYRLKTGQINILYNTFLCVRRVRRYRIMNCMKFFVCHSIRYTH